MSHKVLLVDDEPNVLDGLRRALHKEPYEVVCASSAIEGLSILRSEAIDLVVSDEDMPGMRGTEFLAKVREEFPDTVRFVLTGKATLEVAVEAINRGAVSRFFTKPCNYVELAIAIRESLRQKDLMTEALRLLHTVKRQTAALEALEQQIPGITRVNRDARGAVILSDKDVAAAESLGKQAGGTSRVNRDSGGPAILRKEEVFDAFLREAREVCDKADQQFGKLKPSREKTEA